MFSQQYVEFRSSASERLSPTRCTWTRLYQTLDRTDRVLQTLSIRLPAWSEVVLDQQSGVRMLAIDTGLLSRGGRVAGIFGNGELCAIAVAIVSERE